MFNKLSENQILEKLDKKVNELVNPGKLPFLDDFYVFFLTKYEGLEITPDIVIFSYEQVLKENLNLECNYPGIATDLWMIGTNGQGNEWFISKANGTIWFYDHDHGEYIDLQFFIDFKISFLEFLQLAFLYRDLENLLDEQNEEINERQIADFKKEINSIKSDLYELYPFQYF